MNQSRLEWKVGAFVALGLGLLVLLLILFSKGLSFGSTYTLHLKSGSAGSLKNRAVVAMSGVPVGAISEIRLEPDGKSVTIFLKIEGKHIIHSDARFVIEDSGFLGDKYVSIRPTENKAPPLKDGAEVHSDLPFDLQEVARDASGFIRRINETAKSLNEMIADVRRDALNEKTLTNLAATVTSLNKFSEEAYDTVLDLHSLVQSNAAPISTAILNLQASTTILTNLLGDVQAGRGLAGTILRNDEIATNLNNLVANLDTFSANLNRYGVWHMLWKPKQPVTNTPAGRRGK